MAIEKEHQPSEPIPAPESEWERDYWAGWENELGLSRGQIKELKRHEEEVWNREKARNHQENMQILHGVFYHGTYYHNGVGQPHEE